LLKLSHKKQWNYGNKQSDPGERINNTADEHPQLTGEASRIMHEIDRIGLFVLASAKSVEESIYRPRITPLHRRIGHTGDGHIEVESHANHPEKAHY